MGKVKLIKDQRWEFKADEYGRVHTNVTRLPKALRQCLTIGGHRLVEIDVANCQPLLICLLLKGVRKEVVDDHPQYPLTSSEEVLLSDTHYQVLSKGDKYPISNSSPSPSICCCPHGDSHVTKLQIGGYNASETDAVNAGIEGDIGLYQSLCEQGRFYEYMMKLAGVGSGDRDELKERMCIEIFNGRNTRKAGLAKPFAKAFPHVWAFIVQTKLRNHKRLSRSVQRAESHLMIHTICKRILRQYPLAPLLTIHDAVLTTSAHVETFKRIIMEEFTAVGLKPTLRVKDPEQEI